MAINLTGKFVETIERILKEKGLGLHRIDDRNKVWCITGGPVDIFIHIKESNLENGFWGIGADNIDALNDLNISDNSEWKVVLLKMAADSGYVLDSGTVNGILGSRGFSLSQDGQYKVNETYHLNQRDMLGSPESFVESILDGAL